MMLLDPTYIRNICDYSFGDESGMGIPDGYMKIANNSNQEFITEYRRLLGLRKSYMTLFIDNIRLYRRQGIKYTIMEQELPHVKVIKDQKIQRLGDQDLLQLLSTLTNMKFVIFTGFEDTPIDDEIYNKIPSNVIGIWASNAISFGGKVHAIPYGIQRILGPADKRHMVIPKRLNDHIEPTKLLYLNFNLHNNFRRQLCANYSNNSWTTITNPGSYHEDSYNSYLTEIKRHKFMLCPDGNAMGCECHRDWETLYMRRVPVVEDTEYHREMFYGIPVLFVDDLMNVSEQLLKDNDHLYQAMQNFDMSRLDMEVLYNRIIAGVEYGLRHGKNS